MPYNANENELEILKFWEEHKTFEKSVSLRDENKPYVFYDGPPFATGLPHYGHILSSVTKDLVPRYWTMKGYRVRRRWGWDCHGLPIEQLIEKELKISGKTQIETEFGVDKFNEACESKVLTYTKEWKKMVDREGRWVEFDNSYKTMDPTYMESVWWALKKIWDDGRIYEGRKVLMYCPRCQTPVSKAEIAMDNSYKDITEETAVVKFKVNPDAVGTVLAGTEGLKVDGPVYILAWTTTPWTLPGNVALAVGNGISYALVKKNNEHYILAQELLEKVLKSDYEVVTILSGSDLVGLEYEPLFDMPAMLASGKKAYYVAAADFVSTEDGTGVVHTAVIYGEDDYNLGMQLDLPAIPMLDDAGHFNEVSPVFIQGQYLKKAEKEIKRDLEERGLLFSKEQFTHSYPHCWRCDTQLFYNAISAWFINIQSVKQRMIELNQKVNWHPGHLKDGRFLNILETAPDWNISRNRYWATPLPFWKCDSEECNPNVVGTSLRAGSCKNVVCIGSVKELKEKALNFDEVYSTDNVTEMDLHKQYADKIKLRCELCGGSMTRIPEVIDCWVESGSMPFAEFHYPFENNEVFEKRFPGQFIGEYIAQTRAWFYYMHAMSTLLFDNIGYENVVCTGTILNEKGEKLSKSKQNYTDPWIIIEQHGIDALRYYLMTSVVMQAENLSFNDKEVKDIYNKVINILWNVVTFYQMYADQMIEGSGKKSTNVLDQWILAKLQVLVKDVTENMDRYDTVKAGRPIKEFIDELSTWYLRRSRDRFKGDDEIDKQFALATLREVLLTLSKIMAPFTPFIAEKMFQVVKTEGESVHLEMWPEVKEELRSVESLSQMDIVRKVVEMGLSLRAEAGLKVRQPLSQFVINQKNLANDALGIIADELNVKEVVVGEIALGENVVVKEDGEIKVALHTEVTESLKKEGYVRELVRTINQMRKEMSLTVKDVVVVEYTTEDDTLQSVFNEYSEDLKKSVLATELQQGNGGKEFEVDGKKVSIKIEKV